MDAGLPKAHGVGMTETENTSSWTAYDLVRPKAGRLLAGVTLAIANRFSIHVWLVRVVFIALTASGGVGILLYLAGWVLIPAEGDAKAAAGQFLDRIEGPRAWVGVGLMALAAIIVADSTRLLDGDLVAAGVLILIGVLLYRGDIGSSNPDTPTKPRREEATTIMANESTGGVVTDTLEHPGGTTMDPPPPPPPIPVPAAPLPPKPPREPRPPSILGRITVAVGFITLGVLAFIDNVGAADIDFRHYLGAAMTVIGLGLLVGSLFGRARGLIVVGVIMVPALLVSPVADMDFGANDIRYAPTSVADIQPEYELDLGSMMLDLRDVDFEGADVVVNARIGLGELVVIVPDDVAVQAYGEVGMGSVDVLGSSSGGIGEIALDRSAPGEVGSITVDARADIGRVEISRDSGSPFLGGPAGERELFITSSAELENSYTFGLGDFVLDMSELDMEIDRNVSIDVDGGTMTVILPIDFASEVEASVGLGELTLPDGDHSGINPSGSYDNGPDPRLSLDIEMRAGELIVEEAS
jgi:phage shock protein PspC (stress-responsive transcriptional regulator)/predicted membrane protein